jgi:hypothetical protein
MRKGWEPARTLNKSTETSISWKLMRIGVCEIASSCNLEDGGDRKREEGQDGDTLISTARQLMERGSQICTTICTGLGDGISYQPEQ